MGNDRETFILYQVGLRRWGNECEFLRPSDGHAMERCRRAFNLELLWYLLNGAGDMSVCLPYGLIRQ